MVNPIGDSDGVVPGEAQPTGSRNSTADTRSRSRSRSREKEFKVPPYVPEEADQNLRDPDGEVESLMK